MESNDFSRLLCSHPSLAHCHLILLWFSKQFSLNPLVLLVKHSSHCSWSDLVIFSTWFCPVPAYNSSKASPYFYDVNKISVFNRVQWALPLSSFFTIFTCLYLLATEHWYVSSAQSILSFPICLQFLLIFQFLDVISLPWESFSWFPICYNAPPPIVITVVCEILCFLLYTRSFMKIEIMSSSWLCSYSWP